MSPCAAGTVAAVTAINPAAAGRIPLERRADCLVMASGLLLLKAQLLAPSNPEEAEAAEAAAARHLELLDEITRMRVGADWLAARPQLGHAVFGRGESTPPQARPQAELYVAFLEATLAMLEGRGGEGRAGDRFHAHLPPKPARPLALPGRAPAHRRTARSATGGLVVRSDGPLRS
ncbi:hypothetical protein ACFQX4_24860 [Roseomonas sp. GCM10028921]